MIRILKWTGAGVAGALALALIAAVAAAWLIDPNAFKPRMEAWLERETGRKVTLAGDLSVRFFPQPSLRTGRIVIANSQAFGPGAFTELDDLELRLRPRPLLRRTLVLDPLTIENPRVRLIRKASGETNVDDLLARFRSDADAPPATALALGGIRVKGAVVTLDDRRTGRTLRVDDLALTTGAWSSAQPTAISARFDVARTGVEVDAEVVVDAPSGRIRVPSINIRVRPPGMEDLLLTGTNVRLDPAAGRADLDALELRGALDGGTLFRLESRASIDLSGARFRAIEATVDAVRLNGEAGLGFGDTPRLDFDLVVSLPAGGQPPPRVVALDLRGRGTIDAETPAVVIDSVEATLGPATARGTLRVDVGSGEPRYTAVIEVPAFDPRVLLAQLELPVPETRDPRAFDQVALEATLSGSRDRVTLDPLTLSVDETRLRGSLQLSGILGDTPSAGFTLRAEHLDADRYLPPAGPDGAPGAAVLAPAVLQGWRFDGRVSIGALTAGGVTYDDVELRSSSDGGTTAVRGVAAP